PRSKSKEVNKRFWSAFNSFFHNKSTFFHKLDGERQANLQLKQALVETAKNLKDNADWEKTAQEMKTLQSKWKDIGPVPEKQRDKIFAEFKEACDHFFNRRRTQQDQEDQEQQQNLLQKEALCTELEQQIASGTATANDVASYNERFQSIGFVPRQAVNVVRNRFNAAIEKLIRAESALSEEDKDKALLQFELSSLKDSPDAGRKLQQREQNLRRKIQQVENDLAVLKNNLEFFGRSKNAEKLKAEFNEKIEAHARELSQLKSQLKLLRQAF
ncbi:MAG: DUF349 domain-containing protein, partial [Cyclobacteriaceae bacterium]|nr:DUF349 domain-containing protein [Cyclobacteriaceae bacterium]